MIHQPAQPEERGIGETRSLIARAERAMHGSSNLRVCYKRTPGTSVPGVFVFGQIPSNQAGSPDSAADPLVLSAPARTSWLSFSRSSGVIRSQHLLEFRREGERSGP